MEAAEKLKANPDQPRAELKKNVAAMAKVGRLKKFDDLSIIGKYAEHFGLDPDYVFNNTSFDTVMYFMEMWKESDEYNERFNYIWSELTTRESNANNPTGPGASA